ncbi:hypothetical protein HID58_010462 [Brassica napus]|uniref:Uncharacterized protein n=1 Tax=Brassica napus TaxID=3708 RepID=A0ABQ8DVC5_BRANA|nr:hypothetical protein HID58_010462 [Brassica napus]
MIPKELRRRADKRCGSDVASLLNVTGYTNHRFTLRNRKPLTQNHHRRKRLPLRQSNETLSPSRDLDRRRQSCESLHLAGTGTGVDEAEEASASRRQTKETERKTSPRLPHHNRALTPETGPPWMALFQRSGKAVGRGDKTEAEIDSFAGG